MSKYHKIYTNRKVKDLALIWDEIKNFPFISFPVIRNYINIAVYGVFFYCPSNRIRDSPFAANLALLPRLPISPSYASSTSINISSFNWNYQQRIQGSKAYQSSCLCSGLLFVFGDMVFVIILIDFFHY